MIPSFDGFLNRKINEAEIPPDHARLAAKNQPPADHARLAQGRAAQPAAQQPKPASGGLMSAIAHGVRAHAHNDPMLNHIVSDPTEFQEFLMSAHYVLKAMHPEEREMVSSGPQGMAMLIKRMLADYQQRSPELKGGDIQAGYEKRWGAPQGDPGPGMVNHPAKSPAGRKLLELVFAAGKIVGKDFKPMADKVVAIMVQNGQGKVDKWATEINTAQEMLQKLMDWRDRGVLR